MSALDGYIAHGRTDTCEIYVYEHGIVYLAPISGKQIRLHDVQRNTELLMKLIPTSSMRLGFLCEFKYISSMDREARLIGRAWGEKHVACAAVVLERGLARLPANMLFALVRARGDHRPHRFVRSREEGLEWLRRVMSREAS